MSNAVWYLGIDFGTTGVSAVLLNQSTQERYPIYWSNELRITQEELRTVNPQLATRSSGEAIFRLPAVTYSGPAASKLFGQLPVAPIVVGSLASTLATNQPGIFLQNFKPYLNIGLPYYSSKRQDWEPTLQLQNQQLVSLYWVRRTLQALLATLTPKSVLPDSVMKVGAVGLECDTLGRALGQLEGVVLGYPAAWGDTYHFNLREAVLDAKLVRSPEQIFFLEDAIATLLASLPSPNTDTPKRQTQSIDKISPHHALTSRRGGALVINAGAISTEIALVDLPDNLQDLTYSDFTLLSLPYAGNAIEQDILCQLLYPQLSVTQQQQLSLNSDLELPLPGQPDPQRRDRLTLLLQSSALGEALLKASGYLKLILQHKDEFTLELGSDRWTVSRLDFESSVVLPFIQYLNLELNALLIETGLSEQGIYQVICTGGTAGLGALAKWLQQKLPLATLIQDNNSPPSSWVASGLATLPVYPQVLNRSQQQYSDYFLLLELLRAFPATLDDSPGSYSVEEIMQQLEHRGLNTHTFYERLIRLLEGYLPPGLVPSLDNIHWLSQVSKQNLYYSLLTAESLFSQEENQLYRPNIKQQERLRQYLDIVLSVTHQKFEEPLIVKLVPHN